MLKLSANFDRNTSGSFGSSITSLFWSSEDLQETKWKLRINIWNLPCFQMIHESIETEPNAVLYASHSL